jgi:hypothetical protein
VPFLWTPDAVIDLVPISYPSLLSGSWPAGVSADGEVVVGYQYGAPSIPWIWVEKKGVRLLEDVLEHPYELELSGFTLNRTVGISDDGRVIVVWAKRSGENRWGTLVIKLEEPPNKIPAIWSYKEPRPALFHPGLFRPPSP